MDVTKYAGITVKGLPVCWKIYELLNFSKFAHKTTDYAAIQLGKYEIEYNRQRNYQVW